MKVEKIRKLLQLLVDLEWEYDRMSSSGQESLDKIWKLFGMRTHNEILED
tara:strand:+ start:1423 stop:1572 length:150 start_codon:yes stop_codon:yes gene_type:complete